MLRILVGTSVHDGHIQQEGGFGHGLLRIIDRLARMDREAPGTVGLKMQYLERLEQEGLPDAETALAEIGQMRMDSSAARFWEVQDEVTRRCR